MGHTSVPWPWQCPWHGVNGLCPAAGDGGEGAARSPAVPPLLVCTSGSKIPPRGASPQGEDGGDSHGAGGFIAGGSRRCAWRYFILAGCLGCFSFLLRRAVAGLGDAGIPRPVGCAVAVPGAGGSPWPRCADRASWSDPPCARNSWRSRRGEGAGMLVDGVWRRQTFFPLTPSGWEEGSTLLPIAVGFGGPGGCQAAFPHH